jgi:crotonobetainyl-CoA:carnitine CoA-transferase CaiB-like acyl-CoA transferase
MSFSTDMAELVANQLSRFVTLNRHQLAGQVANLDFWLAQVRHALEVIDGYSARFVRMDAAQEHYVATHRTTTSEVGPTGPRERTPPPPRRIPDRELQKARRALVEAARRFLERCRQDGLISESQLATAFEGLGIG